MFTTFINDCKDDNARARQTSRVGSLLKTNLSFIGVDSDLEAGMQLIDIIDAIHIDGSKHGISPFYTALHPDTFIFYNTVSLDYVNIKKIISLYHPPQT